ncbi:NADH-ubiquinone oxidoreductase [Dipodascopsis uninucleata]
MSRDIHSQPYYVMDPKPMPADIPDVPEIGATSAPLLSASYFIGARCAPYNEDFMLCRENSKNGQADCLKEGRRVTRCAASVLADISKNCEQLFKTHWSCLERKNMEFQKCRYEETGLNACVEQFLNLKKSIPGADGVQVHQTQFSS